MARTRKKVRLIEFKGTTLPVISVTLRSLHPESLATSAAELFGNEAFFGGEAAILELDPLTAPPSEMHPETPDWVAITALFRHHGLHVIGVSGDDYALCASAMDAGLPTLTAFRRPSRTGSMSAAENEDAHAAAPQPASPEAALQMRTETPPSHVSDTPMPVGTSTLIIDRPLRSGQQIYARGGDLVMLAAVNAGAEVIADGSIHVYAPLRGRALAGASGDAGARIFTTRLEAELVSIAGVYRTFEHGIPSALTGRPAKIQLCYDENENRDWLDIQALQTG